VKRRATPSLPGIARRKTRVNALMARQSILLRKKMDARVKSAHDCSTSPIIVGTATTANAPGSAAHHSLRSCCAAPGTQ
jgi:hypothetical protein